MWDDLLDEPGLDEPRAIPPPMMLDDVAEHVAVPVRPDERTPRPEAASDYAADHAAPGPTLPDSDQPTDEAHGRQAFAGSYIPRTPSPAPRGPTYPGAAPMPDAATPTSDRRTMMPSGQAPWGRTLPPGPSAPTGSGAAPWGGAPDSSAPPSAGAAAVQPLDIPPESLAHGNPSGGWGADSGTSSGNRKIVARSVAASTPRGASAGQRALRDSAGTGAVIAASLIVILGGLALAAWLVLRTDDAPLLRPVESAEDPVPARADAPAGNFAAPPATLPVVPVGAGWSRGRVDDATPEERAAAAEAAEAAEVDLVSKPDGVLVDVGGRPLGKTPTSVKLPPGPHIVTFKPSGTRAIVRVVQGGAPGIVDIELPADARKTELLVTSPGYQGAAVRVDGRRMGTAPLIVEVDGGMHVVELIPPRSAPIRQDIYARAASVTHITFER